MFNFFTWETNIMYNVNNSVDSYSNLDTNYALSSVPIIFALTPHAKNERTSVSKMDEFLLKSRKSKNNKKTQKNSEDPLYTPGALVTRTDKLNSLAEAFTSSFLSNPNDPKLASLGKRIYLHTKMDNFPHRFFTIQLEHIDKSEHSPANLSMKLTDSYIDPTDEFDKAVGQAVQFNLVAGANSISIHSVHPLTKSPKPTSIVDGPEMFSFSSLHHLFNIGANIAKHLYKAGSKISRELHHYNKKHRKALSHHNTETEKPDNIANLAAIVSEIINGDDKKRNFSKQTDDINIKHILDDFTSIAPQVINTVGPIAGTIIGML